MKKKLSDYTAGYRALIVLGVLCSAGEAVLELLLPQVMSDIVDIGIKNADKDYILLAGLKMVLMALVALALGVGAAVLASKAGMGFGANLRAAEYRQVQKFSFANIEHFSTASLITRLTNDVNSLQITLMMGMRMLVRAPVMLVTALVMALIISTRLSQVFLVVIPLLVLGVVLVLRKVGPFFTSLQAATDDLNLVVQEDLNAIRVVKSFVREDVEKEKFARRNEKLKSMAEKAFGFVVMFMPLIFLLMGGTIVAVLWIGGNYVYEGNLLSGDLIAFFTYVSEILISLMMVSMVMMMLTRSIACGRRVKEVLNEEPQITDAAAQEGLTVADGSIRFDHVYFRYNAQGQTWNLEDINLDIPSGATVGILGGTGSAKTTLVSLIPRLYEATEGSVSVGGRDVREYTMQLCLRHGAAEKHPVFRHHSGKPPLGRRKRHGRGDAGGLPHRLCRGIHRENARRLRHPYRAGRHQCVRRAEAAPVHRPRHFAKAQGADSGRLHLGGGHRHRRRHPAGAAGDPLRHHQAHHRPAYLLRAGGGHDHCHGRRKNFRRGHP